MYLGRFPCLVSGCISAFDLLPLSHAADVYIVLDHGVQHILQGDWLGSLGQLLQTAHAKYSINGKQGVRTTTTLDLVCMQLQSCTNGSTVDFSSRSVCA